MTPAEIVERVVRMANVVPLARLSDPRTSKVAARQVANYSDAQNVKVLHAVLSAGPFGLTYYDVETKLDMRSAKQRVSDLAGHGLIVPTGETRQAYGAPATVYRASADVVLAVNGTDQGGLF